MLCVIFFKIEPRAIGHLETIVEHNCQICIPRIRRNISGKLSFFLKKIIVSLIILELEENIFGPLLGIFLEVLSKVHPMYPEERFEEKTFFLKRKTIGFQFRALSKKTSEFGQKKPALQEQIMESF